MARKSEERPVDAGAVDAALGRLLEASHHLAPNDIGQLVESEVQLAGLTEAVIYLVDYEQRAFHPLPPHGDAPLIAVEGTLAGRAFQLEQTVEGESGSASRRIWVPMRDGVDRVGLLRLDGPNFDSHVVRACQRLATLLTHLLMTKVAYGDLLLSARRTQLMSLAGEMRWEALPPLTFSAGNVGIACALEPPYTVAGDAFDYAMNGSDLHFAVFDAMGHGLEAALMGNLALSGYRHQRRAGVGLAETYRSISSIVAEHFGDDRFVSGVLAVLDTTTGLVEWIDAGHPRPILLRQHRLRELGGEVSLPFGLSQTPPAVNRVTLEPGDRLVLYTDGLIEARSGGGGQLGLEGLFGLIDRVFSEHHSAAEAVRRVVHTVLDHLEGPPTDDATLLLLSWAHTRPRP